MELRVSSQKRRFSSSDYTSDPEDKEISEDEDDDRNHKHRKRDTHSQSVEGDSPEHVITRPFNKRSKPFVNGYSFRDGDQQMGRAWNNNGNNAPGRDFQSRFDKRRLHQPNFSRGPLDMNQRFRGNQPMSVESGPVRNRGMDLWPPHDARLGLVDVTSQMIQPGPIPGGLFAGRGMPNVSSAFGLIQGLPRGGLDALPPLGFQGPPMCPPMNLGIPLQRCRDFEERGFCLRGDMCPMEHGINRIVVEDVQSLSQFNLPGSQHLGTSGQGSLPVPGSLLNNKAFDAKSNNHVMPGDGLGLNGGPGDDSLGGGPDLYDPDQPLWVNGKPETSAALLAHNQSHVDETESLPDMDPSDQLNTEPFEEFDDDHLLRTATSVSQSSSIWGRISDSKNRSALKGKNNSIGTSSSYLEQDLRREESLQTSLSGVQNQGPWTSGDKSLKSNSDPVRNIVKPSDKAVRTIFVKGIPLKENRKENLLSHFQKFGQVNDIYIPMHTDRAFVQFSKREEAEAALKAPDAVMGNRFIKLWWANRDNIPQEASRNTSTVPITSSASTINPALSHPIVPNKRKENPAGGKDGNARAFVAQVQVNDNHASVAANGPQTPPAQQKKLETLELLKEELRKKQEMLDQKRHEFKSQLDKLQKQAASTKDVTASDQTSKGLKVETSMDHTKAETSKSSPKTTKQEPLRPLSRPPPLVPFVANRFKLDNRPTTFRIVSPIPAGLANVAALEEYFSPFGDLSSVELEESELHKTDEASEPPNVSARVSFKTRRSAEKAFLHGKCWEGNKLQFKWLSSVNSGKDASFVNPAAASAPKDSAEASSSQPQKIAALKPDEPENQTREPGVESVEAAKDSESVST